MVSDLEIIDNNPPPERPRRGRNVAIGVGSGLLAIITGVGAYRLGEAAGKQECAASLSTIHQIGSFALTAGQVDEVTKGDQTIAAVKPDLAATLQTPGIKWVTIQENPPLVTSDSDLAQLRAEMNQHITAEVLGVVIEGQSQEPTEVAVNPDGVQGMQPTQGMGVVVGLVACP